MAGDQRVRRAFPAVLCVVGSVAALVLAGGAASSANAPRLAPNVEQVAESPAGARAFVQAVLRTRATAEVTRSRCRPSGRLRLGCRALAATFDGDVV